MDKNPYIVLELAARRSRNQEVGVARDTTLVHTVAVSRDMRNHIRWVHGGTWKGVRHMAGVAVVTGKQLPTTWSHHEEDSG